MISGKMIQKYKQSIYSVNVNINLMEGNLIPINGGIVINLDVSVKNIIYEKKIIIGILLHIIAEMENI